MKQLADQLSDGVVMLRQFREEDAKEHLAGEDESQIRWLSGGKGNLDSVRNWIKRNKEYWEKDGPVFNFAIVSIEKGKIVGMVEANTDSQKIEGIQKRDANVTYALYPFARGKGYATRAVNLLLNFLKDKGIKRAVIRVNPENINSLNVPVRCGFQKTGLINTRDNRKLVIFVKDLI